MFNLTLLIVLVLLFFVCLLLFFSVLLALRSPRLGKRELVCVLLVHLFVYFAHVNHLGFSFFSSSWCQGLAAACDCDTPWIFLLTFFHVLRQDKIQFELGEVIRKCVLGHMRTTNPRSLISTFVVRCLDSIMPLVSRLPNPTRLERGMIYPDSRPAGVTTRSPRMVTECILTRSMLIKMYLQLHGMCLYMYIVFTVSQFHADSHSVY